jgi:hypothetical protein
MVAPPLLPTQKLASFDVTLNARRLSPTAILKGAQDCRLQRPALAAREAGTASRRDHATLVLASFGALT